MKATLPNGTGLPLPSDPALRQEMGWVLHGAISHLAIRRHIYRDSTSVAVEEVIALHVRAFLAAVPVLLGRPDRPDQSSL